MTYVIAEAGTGHASTSHYDRRERAIELISSAKKAGADAVKFQLFVPDEPLFCALDGDDKRWIHWKMSVLTPDDWSEMRRFAELKGIDFLVSVFQPTAVEYAGRLGMPFWKVASRAARTFPYDKVPGPFLISNGFGLPEKLPGNAHVMECHPQYPTPLENAWWSGKYDGLSDHSGKPWPAIDAMKRGAKFIELHFTCDSRMLWPDMRSSLTREELAFVCKARDDIAAMPPHRRKR